MSPRPEEAAGRGGRRGCRCWKHREARRLVEGAFSGSDVHLAGCGHSLSRPRTPHPPWQGVFWSANQRFFKQMLMVRGPAQIAPIWLLLGQSSSVCLRLQVSRAPRAVNLLRRFCPHRPARCPVAPSWHERRWRQAWRWSSVCNPQVRATSWREGPEGPARCLTQPACDGGEGTAGGLRAPMPASSPASPPPAGEANTEFLKDTANGEFDDLVSAPRMVLEQYVRTQVGGPPGALLFADERALALKVAVNKRWQDGASSMPVGGSTACARLQPYVPSCRLLAAVPADRRRRRPQRAGHPGVPGKCPARPSLAPLCSSLLAACKSTVLLESVWKPCALLAAATRHATALPALCPPQTSDRRQFVHQHRL